MSTLKMVEAKLPAGFRFHPRDEELVCDYLTKKITRSEQPPILMEVDLNKSEPWDIPEYACVGGKEWYFYSQRDRKYATGLRTNRATVSGYWKATGKDRPVSHRNSLVGMRKTLVFYQGRAPKGKKTDWVMHEFRLEGSLRPPKLSSSKEEDWVLCRVFYKNKQGDQHHSPSKQGMGGNRYEDTISSSSSTYLPPLMDDPHPPPPLYNEYQTHHHHHHHQSSSLYEQVSCFSIFNPMNIISSKFITTTTNPSVPNNTFGGGMAPDQLLNGDTSCEDKMVIDVVLNHLMDNININNSHHEHHHPTNNMVKMMMKDSPCSFGEAASTSESFLSEVETIWNHIY